MHRSLKNVIKYVVVLLSLACSALFIMKVGAEELSSFLRGMLFSEPSSTAEMTEEWIKKPVQYEEWAKGADIAISFDQHPYRILKPIIEKYAKVHNLKIALREGTCGVSAGMLYRKAVDIGGFCCPPAETDRLPQLRFHTYGLSGLLLNVHPDNPIDNITLDEAQMIYQGKIRRWSELKTPDGHPGPDMKIETFARLHCKLKPGHYRSLLADEGMFGAGLNELGNIPDVFEMAAVNPRAITGFESSYMAYHSYPRENGPKFLKINGYSPVSPDDLISARYPLYLVFSLTTWEGKGVENPEAQKLVEYLMKQVNNIDSAYNIIPASEFRKAGWKFNGDELVGEPET